MSILREAQKSLFINNSAPGIHDAGTVRIKRSLLLLPVKQILTHRMSPAHIFPAGIKWIVLEI